MQEANHRRVMGFDFGQKRIGVAISSQTIAQPLETIRNKNGVPDWERLDVLVHDWQPDLFVVGKAQKISHTLDKQCTAFCNTLYKRYDCATEMVCEDFSSLEANHYIAEQHRLGLRKKSQQGDTDRIAAALILDTWLALQKE